LPRRFDLRIPQLGRMSIGLFAHDGNRAFAPSGPTLKKSKLRTYLEGD
jgi:hypothetical protein